MKKNTMKKLVISIYGILILTGIITPNAHADTNINLSKGQTVYVPVYAHIYSGLKGRPFDLAVTLSIRNTDLKDPISIVSVNFYDTDGKLLKEYIKEPLQLKALVSTRYVIREAEIGGGSGANFIVEWKSEKQVNPPIIEAIMIGTRSGQGISFVSRGQVVKEHTE
jgi:hypothetical protein